MKERNKPHYSLEFKRDAAQLILSKGYTYPEATSSLGVSASALRKWVNAELVEFDGEQDHVHLLINYPPKVSIAKRVNSLKGVSSRMLRKKNYPEIIKQYIQQQTPL